MLCPGPLNISHIADYIYDFCPLSAPDVGPPVLVCDVEHTSFHFALIYIVIQCETDNNCNL